MRLNQGLQTLQGKEHFDEVTFVSITCDPETDTAEVLGEYADRFRADPNRWQFCRGPWDSIQKINASMFRLPLEQKTHTDHAVVVDRTGKVRGRFVVTDPNQFSMMEAMLVRCLNEVP